MKKRCRFCEASNPVNSNGEHWVVKSIIPARITIPKCPNWKSPWSETIVIEGAKNEVAP